MPAGVRSSCASTCRTLPISTGMPTSSLPSLSLACSLKSTKRRELRNCVLGLSTTVAQKRILLVDDYPDALEIWGLYLRSMGYEVIEADNGLAAVDQAHLFKPDIIVLDLEL